MYKARIYKNTGFNAVNIPRSITVVEQSATSHNDIELTITSPIISGLSVPLTFNNIRKADYVIIWEGEEGVDDFATATEYYGYFTDASKSEPMATDCFMIPLVPDFLTSEGVDNITVIDGITTRSTYALNNVAPNKLTSGDPYLAPSETMELKTEWIGEGDSYGDYVESTCDLIQTALNDDAVTATSSTGEEVTYPVPAGAEEQYFTEYELDDGATRTIKSPGTMVQTYDTSITEIKTLVRRGLEKLRAVGLEQGGVINCARIPKKYVEATLAYTGTVPGITHAWVDTMTGKWSSQATTIDLHQITAQAGTIEEKIAEVLNFSEYTKYGIMSASGESMEADPKDLMTNANPVIRMVGDPRLDGKPYFRFEKINNLKTDNVEFFRNCISGLQWKTIPIVYSKASGNALNTARYQASRNFAEVGYNQAQRNIGLLKEFAQQSYDFGKDSRILGLTTMGIDMGLSALTGVSGQKALLSVASGNYGYDVGGKAIDMPSVHEATNSALGFLQADLSYAQQKSSLAYSQLATVENYSAQKLADALSYGIQQNVIVPEVQFPYNTETLRDFYGNGVLIYRFWYSDDDLLRIYRIIKAYGVKYNMKTEQSHFIPETGQDYCYVQADGVSLANLPQWKANGISAQLQNGVRIWNTKPYHIS